MTTPEPWTIGRLLKWTTDHFRQQGSDSPRLDAEVLLAHACNCKRIELYTKFDEIAGDELRTQYRELVKRRAAGMPIAYLVGQKEFYSLPFTVSPDVLIPRPETEHLIVALLDKAKAFPADVPLPSSGHPAGRGRARRRRGLAGRSVERAVRGHRGRIPGRPRLAPRAPLG